MTTGGTLGRELAVIHWSDDRRDSGQSLGLELAAILCRGDDWRDSGLMLAAIHMGVSD